MRNPGVHVLPSQARRCCTLSILVGLVLTFARSSPAQDLPGIGTAGADTLTARGAAWQRWSLLGDLRVRGDFVYEAPGDEVRRTRSLLRLGAAVTPRQTLELGAAFEAALGTDRNVDNRGNNDNEPSDGLNLDMAYARWRPAQGIALTAGRSELPFQLTALVWDADLRPIGGSVVARLPSRDFDAWRFTAGGYAVRSLEERWTEVAAAQAGYSYQDGGPRGADVRAAFLHFGRTKSLVLDGLARTNRVRAGEFVSDYDLLDLQFAWRTLVSGLPGVAQAEWVENLGADSESSGWRATLAVGDRLAPGHVEVQYIFERLERDAVLAALNSDDWWFHSRLRGHRAVLAVAAGHGVTLEVSGSIERRDDLARWLKRLLLDLHADW